MLEQLQEWCKTKGLEVIPFSFEEHAVYVIDRKRVRRLKVEIGPYSLFTVKSQINEWLSEKGIGEL